ncbi:winged helix-turn-helix transcriptional regulator [Kitasatospora sp. NPDC001540]|uniref:winged helix-turn-helix transcriptional regulator n=1 Tax=Kitasatospora sp. NPDC001540 TaxID=3364014 RepID=UPI00368FB0B5
MDRTRFADIPCSVSRAAGAVADPWTLLVLRDLFLGLRRFEELRQDLGIATNILSARLDHLVAEGLVERRRYSAHPPRDEYLPTDAGRDLHGVVLALLAWGDRHRSDPAGAPLVPRHTTCGHPARPVVACDHCGGELTDGTVEFVPGPGGRPARGTAVVAARLAAGPLPDRGPNPTDEG